MVLPACGGIRASWKCCSKELLIEHPYPIPAFISIPISPKVCLSPARLARIEALSLRVYVMAFLILKKVFSEPV
jgi:hypothetical protein